MALKKKEGAGGFEDEGGTVVLDAPQPQTASPDAATVASTAIAKAASTAVTTPAKKFSDVLAKFEGMLPVMGYGTLPKLVGTSGAVIAKLNGGKEVDLGGEIGFELVSFRAGWTIAPGDDSDDAKEFVAYSDDGIVLSKPDSKAGTSVADYLKTLKETEGYDKASSKKYVYLVGVCTTVASTKSDAKEIIDQMVEVSISPSAITDWDGYRVQTSAAILRGKREEAGAEKFRIVAEKRSGNGKNWTVLVTKA